MFSTVNWSSADSEDGKGMERGRKFKTKFHITHALLFVLKDLLFIYVYTSASLHVWACLWRPDDVDLFTVYYVCVPVHVHLCICGHACVRMPMDSGRGQIS